MKTAKHLGIYMDHSVAHLMELTNDTIVTSTVESQSTLMDEAYYLRKDEGLMHNIEHYQRSDYFKRLSSVMKDYDEVILFGPTDAKSELYNLLKNDHHFDKIRIEVKPADKMTENQQQAYVKKYFITRR
jgi:stalled ribosome rescue protein Dom34